MKLDIHDHFFRQQFSRRQVAIDFIEQLLPPEIVAELDLATLEISQESFVEKNARLKHTDLVYTLRTKDGTLVVITILMEHKSWVPRLPHLQIFRYELGFWDLDDHEPMKKPRHILPVIFHHGSRKWEFRPFSTYFEPISPVFERFIPQQDYLVIDLNRMSDEEIMALRSGFLVNSLLIFKHSKDPVYLENKFKNIFMLSDFYWTATEGREFVGELLNYYFRVCQADQKTIEEKIIPNLPLALKNTAMSTAEQLHQSGLQKGLQKGREEGREETMRETIITIMHTSPDFSDEQIAAILRLQVEFIREIRREFLNR